MKKFLCFLMLLTMLPILALAEAVPQEKPVLQTGDVVTFGHYPQTSAGDDDTPIRWLVLKTDDEKVLLLSLQALDCMTFRPYRLAEGSWWESSTLRDWLNDNFLTTAFTPGEQEAILLTSHDCTPLYNEKPATRYVEKNGHLMVEDRVFLLSYPEVTELLPTPAYRICTATDYAVSHGAAVNKQTGTCTWFTCSMTYSHGWVYGIRYAGDLYYPDANEGHCGIRPALWVSLDAAWQLVP